MYVHMYYRGPRRGSRSAEYFDDLVESKVDLVDEDGGVLRIRTTDGYIDLSMGADELRLLARAFAQRAGHGGKRRRAKPRMRPSASSSNVEAVEPLSSWERLLDRDHFGLEEKP